MIITLPNEDNNTFEWEFPASEQFEAGYHYTYDITVSKTGIEVSMGNITDWDGKDDAPVEAVAGKYKVGDYYPDPDVDLNDPAEKAKIQGVVYWLDPEDSNHGKILSLNEVDGLSWSHHYGDHGAADPDKGIKNMYDIAQYIKNTSYGWNDFPAFSWVHSKNGPNEEYSNPDAKGIWYLPAQSELSDLAAAYNNYGQSAFNIRLTNPDGTAIQSGWYWVSTAYDMNMAVIHNLSTGISSADTKAASFRARCILAF